MGTDSEGFDHPNFRNKSKWSPKGPPSLECFITTYVVSLYPNIPIADSIAEFRPTGTELRNSSILRLLRLVMISNHFTLCGKHYLPISGTATGTRAALNVAITFMNKFEDKFVYTYALLIYLWKHFIDDCFMIWTHSLFELVKFVEYLNSRVETIKFTFEASLSKVNFLDTTVHLEPNGNLSTDLYCKLTDSHSYLRFDSSHPGHCCKSLPYSQFLRMRRICTHETDYVRHALNMIEYFVERGYPRQLLQDPFAQVKGFTRESLLEVQHAGIQGSLEKQDNEVFAISTFQPTYRDFRGVITDNWDLLAAPSTKALYESKETTATGDQKTLETCLSLPLLSPMQWRMVRPTNPGKETMSM